LIHLPAITRQVGIDLTWDRWEELSRSTPFICSILPNNPAFNMKDFDRAGRTIAVMKELAPLLHQDVMTVTGKSLGENIQTGSVRDRRIIRPLDDPFTKDGGIVVMKGNLAPDGGILKKSACPANLFKHRGPARVFDADKYAIEALLNGNIHPGDFVIARYEGPRGCPGARKITVLMHTIVSVGLTDSVVLLTDGGFSGTNFGAGIGYISPEAGIGGPLAVVKEGDEIEMDVENRSLALCIDDGELKRRLAVWTAPEPRATRGTLGLYARYASSHATGAFIL
jgi:dihydroxy-acid dehydratase